MKGRGNNNLVLVADEETATTKSISATSSLITKKITVGPNPNNGNFWFTVNGIEKDRIGFMPDLKKIINKALKIKSPALQK